MKWLRNHHLIESIVIFIAIGVSIVAISTKQIRAQNPEFSYIMLQSNVPVWWRATADIRPVLTALDNDLETLVTHPLFQNRLPNHWGILIDDTWKNSSGFFSDTLKTPEGEPAILFSPAALLDHQRSKALVAHELTHLIHHHLRPTEESWVREGVALLAEWIVTRKYNPVLTEAFLNPETSLIAPLDPRHPDYKDTSKRAAQYGHILQYFIYVYRLCGGDALFENILTSSSAKTGIAFMDEILGNSGSSNQACSSFRSSFRAFSIARMMQDSSSRERYILITRLQSMTREERIHLPPYSSSTVKIKGGQSCTHDEIPWGTSRCIRVRD